MRVRLRVLAVLICVMPGTSLAACGAAFCLVNTDWASQGQWTEVGGKFDLRFEYIDQDQPRHGSDDVGVGELRRHHDEVRTINRNWIAQFDYNFTPNWGVSLSAPLVDRDHTHIHNHQGAQLLEQWDFSKLGDVRLSGRYQMALPTQMPTMVGVSLGAKLPTGEFDVDNDAGAEAERSLQPGTGTTDVLAGIYVNRVFMNASNAFAQLRLETATNNRDGYQPGNRYYLDLGWRYPLTTRFSVQAQLNAAVKERDHGSNAEPDDTGGKFLYFTPGVGFNVTQAFQVYGFVQLPLYQYVNGVQLTADWALVAGASLRF